VPEEIDELSAEEARLKRERQERTVQQRLRRVQSWRSESRERWNRITGPLTHPRPQYVDALGASGLTLCDPKEINRAMWDGKLPFEQPAPKRKYILKSDLRAWMEATGRD